MMKTHPFAVLLALILSTSFIPTHVFGQILSRTDALEMLDRNVAKIRLEMNASPIDATQRLMTLGASIGDEPRVIAICDEVIRTSTNTISRRGAVDALKTTMALHGLSVRLHGRTSSVAHALEGALDDVDTQLRLQAIEVYVSLGGRYGRKAEKLYADAFGTAHSDVDDESKGELIRAIRPLIYSKDSALHAAIRLAVNRANLIPFVQNRVGDPILAGSKVEDEQLLQKLQAVAGEK